MYESDLPLEVETKEQGLALLSYYLGRHLPEQVKPLSLTLTTRSPKTCLGRFARNMGLTG